MQTPPVSDRASAHDSLVVSSGADVLMVGRPVDVPGAKQAFVLAVDVRFAFRMFRISRREIGHSAFRGAKSDISHFATRNRTLRDDQVSD